MMSDTKDNTTVSGEFQSNDLFEASSYNFAHWQRARFPKPIFVDLFLTENCNCRCDYCFVGKTNEANRLQYPVAKRTVDFLLEASKGQQNPGILFFGGEPLLEFDLIRYIVLYAARRAENGAQPINWSMTTNATLMTESIMAFLKEHRIKYLVSVDGGRETHNKHRKLQDGTGSFDLLANKIPLMKRYQPWQGARVTPTPDTVDLLAKNVEELCELGFNQFIIGMASGVPWTEESSSQFIQQMTEVYLLYKKRTAAGHYMRLTLFEKNDLEEKESGEDDLTDIWGCGAGRKRLCVNTRGEIYGCARFAGVDNKKGALKLGDVWNGLLQKDNRQDLCHSSVWRRSHCIDCEYQSQCSGGCPAVNYEETGSIFEPSRFECLSTRVYVELKERIANHRLEK